MDNNTHRPTGRTNISFYQTESTRVKRSPNNRGISPSKLFLKAAYEGNLSAMAELLSRGVSINTQGTEGSTALHTAVSMNHDSVVEFCMDRNIDIDARNDFNDTALSIAVEKGSYFITDLLLQKKVNQRLTNNVGNPLLLIASEQGSEEMVQLLLRYGANPNTESLKRTALYAARFPYPKVSSEYSKAVVKRLLLSGADITSLPLEKMLNDPREDARTYLLYLAYGWNPWHNRSWMKHVLNNRNRWLNTESANLYKTFSLALQSDNILSENYSRIQLAELLRYIGYVANNRSDDFTPVRHTSFSQLVFQKLKQAFSRSESSLKRFTDARADYQWNNVGAPQQGMRSLKPRLSF